MEYQQKSTMIPINIQRMMLGGFAAGIIIFITNGIVNGGILKVELENWMQGMGNLLHPSTQPISMILWTSMSLIYGIVGVWIYVGIRLRYGAEPRTALYAGFLLWIVSKFTVALDFIAIGILPLGILTGQLLGGLFGIMLGVFLGAWIYKE